MYLVLECKIGLRVRAEVLILSHKNIGTCITFSSDGIQKILLPPNFCIQPQH